MLADQHGAASKDAPSGGQHPESHDAEPEQTQGEQQ
jgi:hypothetical protein